MKKKQQKLRKFGVSVKIIFNIKIDPILKLLFILKICEDFKIDKIIKVDLNVNIDAIFEIVIDNIKINKNDLFKEKKNSVYFAVKPTNYQRNLNEFRYRHNYDKWTKI